MKNKYKRTCWYMQLAGIGLYFFQIGCGMEPPSSPPALHYDVACSPLDARNQLRQYFATQRIRTSETTSDNKSFAITTDLISEPRTGKVDKEIIYKLTVKPTDDANTTTIDLSRVTAKSKGVRERDWREDDDGGIDLQSEQQLSKAIQSICRSGQP
jgi:hypothetical protein